jgi:hypothetical protein
MSASAQVAVPTYSMSEFLGTIVASDKFACPTHTGRKAGNFSATGASNHITWCPDMQAAYAVTPVRSAKAVKAKPTQLEDAALRGWASKPRTQRRDARQVLDPVGQQDNTVRSKGRVRITGGYVDPATMPAGYDLDKNGRELKGRALQNRIKKLQRNAVAAPVPTPAATEVHVEPITQSALYDVHKRLLALEVEVARFAPVVASLEAYAAANEDMHNAAL